MALRDREVLLTRRLEQLLPQFEWAPSKERGVTLVMSGPGSRRDVGLYLRTSRNHSSTYLARSCQAGIPLVGWFGGLGRDELLHSPADYWVFLLADADTGDHEFVIAPPRELAGRLDAIHPGKDPFQMYLFITSRHLCWEGRNLTRAQHQMVADGEFADAARDFTPYLDNWKPLGALLP